MPAETPSEVQYAEGCTAPINSVFRIILAVAGFILAYAIVSALEQMIFTKSYSNLTAIVAGVIVAVVIYLSLGQIRGICDQQKLFEFYTKTQKASPEVAKMLVRQNNTISTSYIFIIVIWLYVISRTS